MSAIFRYGAADSIDENLPEYSTVRR